MKITDDKPGEIILWLNERDDGRCPCNFYGDGTPSCGSSFIDATGMSTRTGAIA